MALVNNVHECDLHHVCACEKDGNLFNQINTKDMLKSVRNGLLDACLEARKRGTIDGDMLKDGTPNKQMRQIEWSFYRGAYECLTRMMAEIEGISHDQAMKYLPPVVMIAGLRGESIVDSLKDRRDNEGK